MLKKNYIRIKKRETKKVDFAAVEYIDPSYEYYKLRTRLPKRVPDRNGDEICGLNEILYPENTYGTLERPQYRVEICGLNFKIVPNQGGRSTLFRAISQAIFANESHYKLVQKKVIRYIGRHWGDYKTELFNIYIGMIPGFVISECDDILKARYADFATRGKYSASCIELHAAARRFKFDFGIMIMDKNYPFRVNNMHDPQHNTNDRKYYFGMTGIQQFELHWEYLEPLGRFMEIPNGIYDEKVKQVFVFPRAGETIPQQEGYVTSHALSGIAIIGIDEREFYYRKTEENTLYYILSAAMFGNGLHEHEIRHIVQLRHKILAPVRLSATKYLRNFKPRLTKEEVNSSKLLESSLINSTFRTTKQGSINELRIAAEAFRFSFTLFGLDPNNNKFFTEYDADKSLPEDENDLPTQAKVARAKFRFDKRRDLLPGESKASQDRLQIQHEEKNTPRLALTLLVKADDESRLTWYRLQESVSLLTDALPAVTMFHYKNKQRTPGERFALNPEFKPSSSCSVPLYLDPVPKMKSMFNALWRKAKQEEHIILPSPEKKKIKRHGQLTQRKWDKLHPKVTRPFKTNLKSLDHVLRNKKPLVVVAPLNDYKVVTVHKSKPSTMIPLLEHRQARIDAGHIPKEAIPIIPKQNPSLLRRMISRFAKSKFAI